MKYIFRCGTLDKYYTKSLLLLAFAFFLSIVFWLVSAPATSQAEPNWSFADNPHPKAYMLTQEEENALSSIEGYRDGIELCEKKLQAQFTIYGERYPRFEKSGPEEERLSAWKLHLLNGDYEIESECITEILFLKVLNSNYNIDIVYCGVFSDSAQTEQEQLFVQSLQQNALYADAGVMAALTNFLSLHKPGSNLSLNPDVELFIRKFVNKNDKSDMFKKILGVWYTGHLEPLLTPERIDFVNDAVERGDFKAVLDTTPPCVVE